MRLALPIWNGRISPVFDTARLVLLLYLGNAEAAAAGQRAGIQAAKLMAGHGEQAEVEALKAQASHLERTLESLRRRIQKLEGEAKAE